MEKLWKMMANIWDIDGEICIWKIGHIMGKIMEIVFEIYGPVWKNMEMVGGKQLPAGYMVIWFQESHRVISQFERPSLFCCPGDQKRIYGREKSRVRWVNINQVIIEEAHPARENHGTTWRMIGVEHGFSHFMGVNVVNLMIAPAHRAEIKRLTGVIGT